MEFDEEVVNFKINDDNFPSDKFYVSYMGTSSPLSEDYCEFSNVSVQEIFIDINLSDTSEELEKEKLREKEEKKLLKRSKQKCINLKRSM